MSSFRYTRPDSFPPVIKNLIIINVLVFLAQVLLKQYDITSKLVMWPIMPEGLHSFLVEQHVIDPENKFQPYQIATHLFSHSPTLFVHILFNMFALWMFGRILENVWGAKRFLFFYLACGVGAAALHLAVQYYRCEQLLQYVNAGNMLEVEKHLGAAAPALGASGAVMGVMAAFAYTFPNTELYIMLIPIPVKAKWVVLAYVLIDLFGGVTQTSTDNIAHFAHLGGAITGFIIVLVWNKTNRKTLY